MERIRNFARVDKRALAAVLVLIALLALVSCGGEKTISRIYEESLPSIVIVKILVEEEPEIDGSPYVQEGAGTGLVWDREGHILTNHHVVQAFSDNKEAIISVSVVFWDGLEVDAEIIGTDYISDLAVLKVDVPRERLKPARLGDSDSARAGQAVVAIGHPFNYEFSVTSGIISSVGREMYHLDAALPIPGGAIQTDASINVGNSGGPLLDRNGRVIGINKSIYSSTGVSVGVGFAIPINTARHIVPKLIKEGAYDYPWLGVEYRPFPSSRVAQATGFSGDVRGALITQVFGGSPAEVAGLLIGDVVVGVDRESLWGGSNLDQSLVFRQPGDKVTLLVIRGGEMWEIEAILGSLSR